jgi:hypothetical protein
VSGTADEGRSLLLPLLGGGALVVLLGAVVALRTRRRAQAQG